MQFSSELRSGRRDPIMSSGAETPSNRPIFMPPEGAPKVVAAIVGVMRDIPKIQKTGTNREHKYNFVEATVLTALVRDQMQKHGLVINPREISRTVQSGIMFIKYEYDLYCEEQAVINAGSCTGSFPFEFKSGSAADKAVSKCYTSALSPIRSASSASPLTLTISSGTATP